MKKDSELCRGRTISGEQFDGVVWQEVDLAALPVVLELCQEAALKLPQCVWDALTDFCQHWLQGNACVDSWFTYAFHTCLLNQKAICAFWSSSRTWPFRIIDLLRNASRKHLDNCLPSQV